MLTGTCGAMARESRERPEIFAPASSSSRKRSIWPGRKSVGIHPSASSPGGRPAEHVDDSGAEPDALGAGGKGAKDGDGIRPIRLRHPHRFEAEGLGALSELDRFGEREAALVGQVETELHRGIVPGRAPRV